MKETLQRAAQRILYPRGTVTLLLVILAAVLLALAFTIGGEASALSLFAYAFSAYALTIVCLKIPKFIQTIQEWLTPGDGPVTTGNAWLDKVLAIALDYDQRSRYILSFSLGFNLIYAVFKLVTGIVYHSYWMSALGIYYAVLAMLRFSLMRSLRGSGDPEGRIAYHRTAWRLNFLTLVMSGVFIQMVLQNQSYHYHGILIYVMALYSFLKIITAIVNLIKRQKEENKALAAARCLSFAGALMSILALQTAMIDQFGEDSAALAKTMNSIGGAVVTALLITLSALMIARSSEWKKQLPADSR